MNTLKVALEKANNARKLLNSLELLDKNRHYSKDDKHMYFPILEESSELKKFGSFVEKKLEERERTISFEEGLKQILSEKELELVKTGRDNVGTITILEIPDELRTKEKQIAELLLETENNVKTVLRKDSAHDGEFRTQNLKYLAGEKTKVAVHKENNTLLKVNVETVYFSVRLSTERKRITELVKPNEEILVMFSGVAPYPCVLAKNTEAKKIVGIELNPEGHKFGLENVKLNKLKNVFLYNDDALNSFKITKQKFDRIIMPLPRDAPLFIEAALECSRKGTIIHLYNFVAEDEIENEGKKLAKKHNIKLLNIIKAGQYSPHQFRICYEFLVE